MRSKQIYEVGLASLIMAQVGQPLEFIEREQKECKSTLVQFKPMITPEDATKFLELIKTYAYKQNNYYLTVSITEEIANQVRKLSFVEKVIWDFEADILQ